MSPSVSLNVYGHFVHTLWHQIQFLTQVLRILTMLGITYCQAYHDVNRTEFLLALFTSSIFKLSAATQSWLSEFDTQNSGLQTTLTYKTIT